MTRSKSLLRGLLVPLVTPFEGEEVALGRFETNVAAHLAAGVDGVVIAGSTGEAPLIDDSERLRMTERARPLVDGDQWLIAGTGAESTRQCVSRCRTAAAAGADAVLVVAPHYYTSAMTPAALLAHYTRVADSSPCPVVLYNIPKYAHFTLVPGMVAELAEHENVIGIKDSAGDLALLGEYIAVQSESFSVLTGSGSTFLGALQRGARGGVLAVALFAPELACRVMTMHDEGSPGADEAQACLTPLALEIVNALGVAGIKAALDAIGLCGGAVRAPLPQLPAASRAHIRELLRDALGEQTAAA